MKYFAYGSNLLHQRLLARTPSAQPLGVASLEGYDLRFHKKGTDGSGKADAFFSGQREHVVWGVIYELTAREKLVLDQIEDLGRGYEEREVALEADFGPTLAFAYLAMARFRDETMVPFHWYKEFVLAGAIQNAFPEPYIQRIRETPSRPDPNSKRSSAQQAILKSAHIGPKLL